MKRKAILLVLLLVATVACCGCISDEKKEPQPNARVRDRIIEVKDIDVLELEEHGEIRLYGVEPGITKKLYEEGVEWLKNTFEGKTVIVWFGEKITRDEKGRPYAMVFIDEKENSSINTELIIKHYSLFNSSQARNDFLLHGVWAECYRTLKEELESYGITGYPEVEELWPT